MPSYFVTIYAKVDSPRRYSPKFEGRTLVNASNENTALRRGTEKIAAAFSNFFSDPSIDKGDRYDDVIDNSHLTFGIEEQEIIMEETNKVEILKDGEEVAEETYLDIYAHQSRAEHLRFHATRER